MPPVRSVVGLPQGPCPSRSPVRTGRCLIATYRDPSLGSLRTIDACITGRFTWAEPDLDERS